MNPNPNHYGPPQGPPDHTPLKKEQRLNPDSIKSLVSLIALMVGALLIALSIAAFVIQSYQVDGESMETALQDRDRLIVDKLPRTIARLTHHPYIPHRGDIIIFNESGLIDSAGNQQKQLIKRVVAVPGERVVVKEGFITVYNSAHPEGFNPDNSTGYRIAAKDTPGNIDFTLQDNEVFVCGDNRPNSEDSRYFGPVQADDIVGKLVVRIFPLGKVQRF